MLSSSPIRAATTIKLFKSYTQLQLIINCKISYKITFSTSVSIVGTLTWGIPSGSLLTNEKTSFFP